MLPRARRQLHQRWSTLDAAVFPCNPHSSVRFASHRPLDLPSLDTKWQAKWAEGPPESFRGKFDARKPASKSYVLPMFPYPSGNLHMGHFRVYTISDVLARFKRLQDYNVLHPMGWDAFGLPAENAAIERGIDPVTWTDSNIANMKTQLQAMNTSFDWDREIRTCDPDFFKHTQLLFLLLYQNGLAYQSEALVNYDPIDRTVLANEQVDSNGFSWRSGAKVERQLRKQWFLRITAYKEALLNDLNILSHNDRWPAQVLAMQKNWLGRSQGARITFGLIGKQQSLSIKSIQVFTTRPDTLHGVQYLALSISHPIVQVFASQQPALQAFIASVPSLPADSKAGFLLSGITASNPLSGVSNPGNFESKIPVFVAPYVLDYGEKAVMGVPGHDSRDLAFWRANYRDKDVQRVIEPAGPARDGDVDAVPIANAFEGIGVLASTCGDYAGLPSDEASKGIISDLGELAGKSETWKIRDWLISRQRYWGTPIPIIHCPKCGPQPVPKEQLPVPLPRMVRDASSGNIAENDQEWLNTECPACGCQATRETDTMDTFMDSSWYFMRFTKPRNKHWLVSREAADSYLPVDIYIGGIEHAILHLLYARFISKFLTNIKVWPSGGGEANRGEPFRQVISQGMVHGKTFTDPQNGRYLKPEELDLENPFDPKITATGETPNISWEKMSKSKYNGVDPISCVSKYGADVTRAHMLFQAPVSQVLEWDEERIVGIERWFIRIWRYLPKPQESAAFETARFHNRQSELQNPRHKELNDMDNWAAIEAYFNWWMKRDPTYFKEHELKLWIQVQKTIKSVTVSLSTTFALNTVISDLMELSNALIAPIRYRPAWQVEYQSWSIFLRLLAPVAPAFAEECWERVHALCKSVASPKLSIFHERWPEEDGMLPILENRGQTCSVQENGKFRFAVDIERPPEGLHEAADLQGLKDWAVEQIGRTEPGKRFLEGRVFEAMHVARKGKTVNFVSPKAPTVEDIARRDDPWA